MVVLCLASATSPQKAPAITALVTNFDWDARLDNGRDYAFFDLGMAAMNYQLQAIEAVPFL